jgi:hypothetical protein
VSIRTWNHVVLDVRDQCDCQVCGDDIDLESRVWHVRRNGVSSGSFCSEKCALRWRAPAREGQRDVEANNPV